MHYTLRAEFWWGPLAILCCSVSKCPHSLGKPHFHPNLIEKKTISIVPFDTDNWLPAFISMFSNACLRRLQPHATEPVRDARRNCFGFHSSIKMPSNAAQLQQNVTTQRKGRALMWPRLPLTIEDALLSFQNASLSKRKRRPQGSNLCHQR